MAVQEFVRKLKETVDIVDVIGEQVALKRAGARYKGLSPFSQEKTPSFFVNPETQNFYCFSTNKGGDVIDFVMETKGMSFTEAVRWLAERAGIDVPRGALGRSATPAEKEEKAAQKQFLKVNKFVAHFFQSQFQGPQGAVAREYAKARGLDEKTLKNFAIGFAPDSWNSLRDYLIGIKAPLDIAVTLGLLKAKNDEKPRADGANLYDVFRNRLIFPIRDGNGEVVGFGGRALDSGKDKIKYLNSPESPVFSKGHMFFNYDRARKHIRDTETAIVVEGYMDCIALDQAGFGNVIATLGTALTPTHVQILRKVAQRTINLYDSDAAGQQASIRNMELFLREAGFPIAGVVLPEGKDPDDFLRARPDTGVKELQELLHHAPALLDQWVDQQISAAPKTVQGRADCLKIIAEKLALLADPISVKARVPGISERLILDEKLVMEAILHARKERGGAKPGRPKAGIASEPRKIPGGPQKTENFARKSGTTWAGFEAQFLRYLLLYPERLRELRRLHEANDRVILPLIENAAIARIIDFLLRPLAEGETEARRLGGVVEALDLRQESALKNFISKALAESAGQLAPAASLSEALRKLRNEVQEKRTQELKARIKQAEASGDLQELELLQRKLVATINDFRTNSMETMNG